MAQRKGFWARAVDLYVDGFRSMTLGKTLWLIIAIKLFKESTGATVANEIKAYDFALSNATATKAKRNMCASSYWTGENFINV